MRREGGDPVNIEQTATRRAVLAAVEADRASLLAVVRRRVKGRVDPEDVLQNALARAMERMEQVRDPARAGAWLGRIVRNAASDACRSAAPRGTCVDPTDVPAMDESRPGCGCVLEQVRQLKAEYATILTLVIVEGRPVTQVATELGLTPNNAMVRLHRARKALREQLREHCGTTDLASCADCACQSRGCCKPETALGSRMPRTLTVRP
jgi:RNA polymerase sigma factor (sigma-70 family)